ncbi:hypothetical protein SLUN_23040 [Streptomyces lunaelactis]|uniref:DUF2269 domain-containing protein n=1 Tax=Streptomyces lunaelactis TaxID=1535768 RepID=A0A2R4T696_9ACTN|nr:hypothetical protein [Streptomyces lunaelactis]AVZ74617.1 hypothetical protein SLUN_23040 [Streptomyces lunaelactis]NUK89858.1 hypothetical protein [Streptomyces lunaelactis]NUL05726.1 hypothetical protein [Streptomyces lunaelactis]
MTKFLLAVHVLAAIITIGPVTVAASMFPPAARRALAAPDDPSGLATVRTLHRICRVYAVIAVAVPVFGLATANSLHVLGSAWLLTSIALTALAAAVLGARILPRQASALAALDGPAGTLEPAAVQRIAGQLGMLTGVFNLLWATVTVLMIIRPGSTTGA